MYMHSQSRVLCGMVPTSSASPTSSLSLGMMAKCTSAKRGITPTLASSAMLKFSDRSRWWCSRNAGLEAMWRWSE